MKDIKIPVSVGELLDKISILQIKSKYIKSDYVYKELEELTIIAKENQVYCQYDIDNFLEINQILWDVEDKLRIFEKDCIFNEEFISLARSVYTHNDRRANIKKQINDKYESRYKEIKVYKY